MDAEDFISKNVNTRGRAKDSLRDALLACLVSFVFGVDVAKSVWTHRAEAVQAAFDHAILVFMKEGEDMESLKAAMGRRVFDSPFIVMTLEVSKPTLIYLDSEVLLRKINS